MDDLTYSMIYESDSYLTTSSCMPSSVAQLMGNPIGTKKIIHYYCLLMNLVTLIYHSFSIYLILYTYFRV
jgi:hypothetical protein